jgi:tRNA-specific 2-thiouridylase
LSNSLLGGDINLIALDKLEEPLAVAVKARYRQQETPAIIAPLPEGLIQVSFQQPQRALTPGQAAVFYQGETVIGGGTIR